MSDLAAVLFDFGGVIVPGPFTGFREVAHRAGISSDAVREINSMDPDTNAWACAERGELSPDEFVDRFEQEARDLGYALSGQSVLDVLTAMTPARSAASVAMLDAVDHCRRRGLKLGVITNNIRAMGEDAAAMWLFAEFDSVVESSVVGSRKPEPEIYELALADLGVTAERTVLLDDLGINLKPAKAMGMTTIKVVDPDAAAAALRALIGR